jgi:hypothetical protein
MIVITLFYERKSHAMRARLSFLSFLVGLVLTVSIHAGEIRHFTVGVPNIRNFQMPEPNFAIKF